jgi:hypothetical protein
VQAGYVPGGLDQDVGAFLRREPAGVDEAAAGPARDSDRAGVDEVIEEPHPFWEDAGLGHLVSEEPARGDEQANWRIGPGDAVRVRLDRGE